ncbi:MAG: hypothetical protein JXR96_17690 [Deltaproteobacteria bacterium]|nr:hypothetical protein [Deltaproteobacteria bacterium]
MRRRASLSAALAALGCVWLAAVGCESPESLRTYCSDDLDCPAGYRCERETGLCVCATDEVCGPDEYCAPDGRCRRSMACDSNLDCPDGEFCDSTTGNCLPEGMCTADKQCPLGQICSETRFVCVPGCRIKGDCPLGQICRQGACKDGCDDKYDCDWGQLCDRASETCYHDTRGPYCAHCASATIYDPSQCAPGPNYCLIKGGDLSLAPYCGVDCSQGEKEQPCPNGYDCFSVRLVYTSENCSEDWECSSGKCYIKEGDEKGFCLCTADSQCPDDSCDETTFECRYTRKNCTPGGNECDRPIYCIDGFCHIGWNCKPVEGLRCEDLIR